MKFWKLQLVNYIFLALAISAVILLILFSLSTLITPRNIHRLDFIGYITAGHMILDGRGDQLYDLEMQNEYQQRISEDSFAELFIPFRKVPIVAAPFALLAKVSLIRSYQISILVNIVLITYLIFLLIRTFPQIWKSNPFLFLLPFFYLPVILTIVHGQISILIAVFFLEVYRTYQHKKPFMMGMWATLLIIKTQYLVFWPFFLLLSNTKKRFLLGTLFTGLCILVASFFISGLDWIWQYPQFLIRTESVTYNSYPQFFYTLYGFIVTLFPSYKQIAWSINSVLYVLFFISEAIKNMYYKMHVVDNVSRFLFYTFVSLVLAVQVLGPDLVLLVIPMYILINSIIISTIRDKTMYIYTIALLLFILPIADIFRNPFAFFFIFIFTAYFFSRYDAVKLFHSSQL